MDNKSTNDKIKSDAIIPTEATVEFGKPETVNINPEVLKSILDRMDENEKELKTLRKAVSQSKLTEVENASKKPGLPTTYLKIFMDKVVVSWKTEKSEYLYNPSNPDAPIGEILKAIYFFMDGSNSGIVDQVFFTRATERLEAEIMEGLKALQDPELKNVTLHFTNLVTTNEDLKNSFVMPPDYVINKNFINP